ncbi:MAG: hypothetical protein DRJ07_01425 [Bacteroidetes bacterium]|nr:MAG: hypothetical protein DRJ07_01425 [Bacteroidota bacterium]
MGSEGKEYVDSFKTIDDSCSILIKNQQDKYTPVVECDVPLSFFTGEEESESGETFFNEFKIDKEQYFQLLSITLQAQNKSFFLDIILFEADNSPPNVS